MSKTHHVGIAVLALLILAGCGLPGRWTSESFEPQIARDRFGLIAPPAASVDFSKATIYLQPDGTYTAEVYFGDKRQRATGTWEPSTGKLSFLLSGLPLRSPEFTKTTIWIHRDGTYVAETYYGENLQRSSGKWEQTGGKLTFVDSAGVSQTYRYELSSDAKELKISRTIKGTDVVLVLARD